MLIPWVNSMPTIIQCPVASETQFHQIHLPISQERPPCGHEDEHSASSRESHVRKGRHELFSLSPYVFYAHTLPRDDKRHKRQFSTEKFSVEIRLPRRRRGLSSSWLLQCS